MPAFLWVAIIIIAILWLLTRFGAWALRWGLRRYLHAELKIGWTGIFSLGKIHLGLPVHGLTLDIENVGLSSCIFNPDAVRKPLVICASDIRVQLDMREASMDAAQALVQPSSKIKPASQFSVNSTTREATLDRLFTVCQYAGIRLQNITVIIMKTLVPQCMLHVTGDKVTMDINVSRSSFQAMLNIGGVVCRALQGTSEESNPQPCLAELFIGTFVDMTVAKDLKSIKSARILISDPRMTVSEGFLRSIPKVKMKPKLRESAILRECRNVKEQETNENQSNLIIPKEIGFYVTRLAISISQENKNSNVSVHLKTFQLELRQESLDIDCPEGIGCVLLEEFLISSPSDKYAQVDKLQFKLEVEKEQTVIDTSVTVCHFHWPCDDMLQWQAVFAQLITKSETLPKYSGKRIQQKTPPNSKLKAILHSCLSGRKITCNGELSDVQCKMSTEKSSGLVLGLSHFKLTWNSKLGIKVPSDSPWLHSYDVAAELDVQSVYCHLLSLQVPLDTLNKKKHYWSNVLYLGIIMIKVSKLSNEVKLEGMKDNVQLEWSTQAVDTLLNLVKYLPTSQKSSTPLILTPSETISSQRFEPSATLNPNRPQFHFNSLIYTINYKMSNLNVFAGNNYGVCLLLCLDSISLEHRQLQAVTFIDSFKVLYITSIDKFYPLQKCADIKNSFVQFQGVNITYRHTEKEMTVLVLNEIQIVWKTSVHLCLIHFLDDLANLRKTLPYTRRRWLRVNRVENKEDYQCQGVMFSWSNAPTLSVKFPSVSSSSSSTCSQSYGPTVVQTGLSVNIILRGRTILSGHLPGNHMITLRTETLVMSMSTNELLTEINWMDIEFDGHAIFDVESLMIGTLPTNHMQREREVFKGLNLYNKAWTVELKKVIVEFPYNYNFSACFEEVVNIFKWFKLVHKIPKKEFTLKSKLPPDLKIKIQEFSVHLCDDLFEVKLRDNYELLSDEWAENEKRRFVLDQKILDLRKAYVLLPGSSIEDLYTSLAKKSAEIYIQRSKQLYCKAPIRSKLFTWHVENLEIVALADLSYHGKKAVVDHMKQMDADSPYPEEGLEFNTLWCRMVIFDVKVLTLTLRDYPQPMLDVKDMHAWGKLIGAVQEGVKRSKRSCVVEVDDPWENMTVERSLPSIKFFYDLSCDIESFTMAYGSCWEPTFAQTSLMMEMINKPSVDPSRPLPFWDKLRLLLHGRLTMSVQQMSWLYHASFDPCNITEFMDWTWTNLILDWTNGKFALKGDLDIYARTASKYDDCRMLHLPNLKFCVRLEWLCLADSNDHHSVMPCAPDKVPDYSMEEHDSFKGFRSQNLNLNITLETKASIDNPGDFPICLFFASTLRFMDRIKLCLTRVTRPIKRGILFQNTKPKKPQLSRHYKQVKMSVNFHQFSICYWMSFSKQHGSEMQTKSFNLELCNELVLIYVDDGLVHRPRASWTIRYLTCELLTTQIWLCSVPSATEQVTSKSSPRFDVPFRAPVEKNVFLSVSRVSYQRADETKQDTEEGGNSSNTTPTHMVQVYDMKGAWTRSNRTVLLGLYDGFIKSQTLKRNLSSEALKGFKLDNTRPGYRSKSSSMNTSGDPESPSSPGPIPLSNLHSGHATAMLNKLVSETDKKSVAFTEEPSEANMEQLHGIAACQTDDVLKKNWLIELFNSQVMLKGCETAGYVIVSAAKAQILSCIHKPFWKGRQLCSKTTWVGSLECMQYYATVDPGEVVTDEDIAWLSKENIEDRSELDLAGLPEMVGSGQSVGGVVNSTVFGSGPNGNGGQSVQLQRIVARCRCQFFYAGYGEVESEQLPEVMPMEDLPEMMQPEEGSDTTTVLHHDCNVCTNSLQYAMILDIVNNLLLHVESNRKQASEKLLRMRFQLQLSTVEDQRSPILVLQENVRKQVQKLRRLEKELYMIHKDLEDECADAESLHQESKVVEQQLFECKEQINGFNEELTIRISCYKEGQVQFKSQLQTTQAHGAQVVRTNEVCFKFAQWRLTESDGQLGIADLVLRNFVYTKVNRDNDTWTHQLELGWVRMTNLLPNPIYKDVLVPRPIGQEGENKQMTLRIVCSERPPVGGIAVKEHFEVNVVPLQIQLTYQFFKSMMVFFFPERNIDIDDQQDTESDDGVPQRRKTDKKGSLKDRGVISSKKSAQYITCDDIDKMKERAENNNTFLYIKIPEVSLKVSYKGEKEKNFEDLHDFSLVLPTLEYHNCIWTWFDLLMTMKNDSKKILLAQALRQKFHMRSRAPNEVPLTDVQQEEDKAKMLLGAKLLSGQEKPVKKTLFGKPQK